MDLLKEVDYQTWRKAMIDLIEKQTQLIEAYALIKKLIEHKLEEPYRSWALEVLNKYLKQAFTAKLENILYIIETDLNPDNYKYYIDLRDFKPVAIYIPPTFKKIIEKGESYENDRCI